MIKDGPPIPPMGYADWFRRHAATRPNFVAIATPRISLTYEQFHRALHRTAYRLAESNIEAGQVVGVCIKDQALHCVLIAALNRMGCVHTSLQRPLLADTK